MQAVIEYLTQHPLYAVGAIVLLLFLIIALVKKMIKVAILAVALNMAYGYYLNDVARDAYAKAKSSYKATKGTAKDLFDEAGKLIK